MSLLDLADKAKDAKEPQSQPDGQYKLSITKLKDGESGPDAKQPGEPYTMIYFRVENPKVTPAQPVSNVFMHVTDNTDPDQADMRALAMKRLMSAFKITREEIKEYEATGKDEKIKGRSAWAQLIEEENARTGEMQNRIQKYINPE